MTIKISAIVCTYNRKNFLSQCLDSFINQDYDNYEVIVVDDGSVDGTDQMVGEYKKNVYSKVTFRYIKHEKNKGLGAARNTAVKNAQGEVVAFTDDDSIVSRDWVSNIAKYHLRYPDVAAVGGLVFNGFEDNIIARIGQQIVTYYLYDRLIDNNYTKFLVGNNQSYKKNAVEDVGYFEEGLIYGGEEAEIQNRLIKKGYKMIFSPDITVTHFQRSTLKSFLKQYYKYGIGQFVTDQKKQEIDIDSPEMSLATSSGIVRLIKRPYLVSKHVEKTSDRLLCFPLVYLSSLMRAAGYMSAKFGVR